MAVSGNSNNAGQREAASTTAAPAPAEARNDDLAAGPYAVPERRLTISLVTRAVNATARSPPPRLLRKRNPTSRTTIVQGRTNRHTAPTVTAPV